MRIAVFIMLVLGVTIGSLMPAPRPRVAAAVTAPAAAEAPRETVVARNAHGHFVALAEVNDEPVNFVVDTGADTVALTMDDATRAHVTFNRAAFYPVGMGAGGPVRGQEVRIKELVLDGKRATDVPGVVLEGADISLLGHSYLKRLDRVSIEGDTMRLR